MSGGKCKLLTANWTRFSIQSSAIAVPNPHVRVSRIQPLPSRAAVVTVPAQIRGCAILFVAQAQAATSGLIAQSVDESKQVTLAGNTRPEANAKFDLGRVADRYPMEHMMLQLKRSAEQERELRQFIEELTDSSSPNFHQWLTAKEFGERFGLAQQDLDTITHWLQSHGLKVNVVYENGVLIDFSGTAGQVRAAFHTDIHRIGCEGRAAHRQHERSEDPGRSGAGSHRRGVVARLQASHHAQATGKLHRSDQWIDL